MDLTTSYEAAVPPEVRARYAWAETRNAAAVIASTNPIEFADILAVLREFQVDVQRDLIDPGRNESRAAALLNGAFRERGWREGSYKVTLSSRLTLRPYRKAGEKDALTSDTEVDATSYKIDNLKGKVAVDVEWHAKDGNLDRDISAYRALYDAGIIEAAAIITVAQTEMKDWAQEVTPGTKKFGTSTTTNIEKAVPRLRRGDGGGCPIVVIGIGRRSV
jgi:hypothetical protein